MTVFRNRETALAFVAVFSVGAWIRVHNAITYPEMWGFDAPFNWAYIQRLLTSLALPAPDFGWAEGHPPLFYYAAAGMIRVLSPPDEPSAIIAVRLVSSAAGLLTAALAAWLVVRADPGATRRGPLAGALVLFLPAHVMMCATLGEEILASFFSSLAIVGAALTIASPRAGKTELQRAGWVGLAAGLAWLTKLSGVLAIPAAATGYLVDGWRRRNLHAGISRCVILASVAGIVSGWFYLRNRWLYGYVYPEGLKIHGLMHTMPPGERHVADYFWLPIATFTDAQLLNPDLLHSVWGSTYATLWFDGHRFFLPTDDSVVRHAGTLLLVLALLPTAAFFTGLARGCRRAWVGEPSADVPLLSLLALTLTGYVMFTWRNPWFATVKGSYLLTAVIPFAFYASEGLANWTRRPGLRALAVWIGLSLLALGVVLVFSFGLLFTRTELPGLHWIREDPLH